MDAVSSSQAALMTRPCRAGQSINCSHAVFASEPQMLNSIDLPFEGDILPVADRTTVTHA
jgi:hypothetical protein